MAQGSIVSSEVGHDAVRAARSPVDRGRLGVYAALGGFVGAVPLPWVPDALARRVRGALVHDVASRRGLTLSREARDVLAEPSGPDGPRGVLTQAIRYLGAKMALRALASVGPIGVVWPLRTAVRTYVLGHLFDRYLELARTERAARVDVVEARRARQAIDGAILRALTVETSPVQDPALVEDERDAVTALVDNVLGAAAGVPSRLLRRLDAAFDDIVARADG